MPRSAIATGAVDQVLTIAKIAQALVAHERGETAKPAPISRDSHAGISVPDLLPEIIQLLRTKTVHDFTLYKHGTLERRVERRMAMAAVPTAEGYLALLQRDGPELEELSRDLLINVTAFFRDAAVFEYLAKTVIPRLMLDHPPDRPLRIWIAGCSSGEETYSLAMLIREQIIASKRDIKLQIFASDVDPDAVATAREGVYPPSIEANVSSARLAQFFSRDDRSYRVSPELRANVVFTVQDVLADPPFARLDFISCRNLLIYLNPEAQAKAIGIFHFALREGGFLLVGNAETVNLGDGLFEVVSKPERVYRRIGGNRPGDFVLSANLGEGSRMRVRPGPPSALSRQEALAELCRRHVQNSYGPAAVLVNSKLECLHFQGPTDVFLKVASGRPSLDLIGKAREGVRTKLRTAIHGARQTGERFVVAGGRIVVGAETKSFGISVEPIVYNGQDLFLVCFVEAPTPELVGLQTVPATELPRVAELERELQATKLELQIAVRTLETSSEEQMAINEEALSVNEEYQSTNEELLASKEELQSLNEELNALNSQLQETLERQRTTADDLQNVLYSTDVATIFLDTRLQHPVLHAGDQGPVQCDSWRYRAPLTDLKSLSIDAIWSPTHGRFETHRRSSGKSRGNPGLVYAPDLALSHPRPKDGRRGHHLRGRHGASRHFRGADRCQEAGRNGQCGQIAISSGGQP